VREVRQLKCTGDPRGRSKFIICIGNRMLGEIATRECVDCFVRTAPLGCDDFGQLTIGWALDKLCACT
jgi:hypothetical protein